MAQPSGPLSEQELASIDAYWRAANYLSVGQIYLLANPLLREPLRLEHTKPRLLGHWGTTPGLNLLYAHMNRLIRARDIDAIFIAGPGHGGPGVVANVYLEGTYTEVYPQIGHDEEGLRRLFRQFSFPGGIPSHVSPETPGSIHEGGELGYAVVHAYGAAFDNPDLLVCCVIGDGEAETGPLSASWHSNKFLNPARDGAPADGRRARPGDRQDRRDPARGPLRRREGQAALADDRAADAQGLDGSEGGRRAADGGLVPLTPGPAGGPRDQAGAPGPARAMDALLPPRGAVRRARGSAPGAGRARPARRAADG